MDYKNIAVHRHGKIQKKKEYYPSVSRYGDLPKAEKHEGELFYVRHDTKATEDMLRSGFKVKRHGQYLSIGGEWERQDID